MIIHHSWTLTDIKDETREKLLSILQETREILKKNVDDQKLIEYTARSAMIYHFMNASSDRNDLKSLIIMCVQLFSEIDKDEINNTTK